MEQRLLLTATPQISNFSVSADSTTSALLTYAVSADATVQVWMQGPQDKNFHTISATSVDDHTYRVSGLLAGTSYSFELVAESDGVVGYSSSQSCTTPSGVIYDQITGLTVTGEEFDSLMEPVIHLAGHWGGTVTDGMVVTIDVTTPSLPQTAWMASAPGSSPGEISYGTGNGIIGAGGAVSADVYYPATGIPIVIRAQVYNSNTGEYSLWSDPLTTQWDGDAIPAPDNAAVTYVPAGGGNSTHVSVSWNWTPNEYLSSDDVSFGVEDLVNGQLRAIYDAPAGSRQLDIADMGEGDHQYYVVASLVDNSDHSVAVGSNTVTVPPNAPSAVRATLGDAGSKISITWDDSSAWETGYRIERKVDGDPNSNWQSVGTVGADIVNYTDTLPADYVGKLYDYRVIAYNGGGDSAPVNAKMTVKPTYLQAELLPGPGLPDIDDAFGGSVDESLTTGFHVELYSLDSKGQEILANAVKKQSYTIDAGAAATINSVTDSRGASWQIDGSRATAEVVGPSDTTSFDIVVTVTYASPGLWPLNLNSNVEDLVGNTVYAAAVGHGRSISSPIEPGEVSIPNAIYHIEDPNGAGGNGHSAVIIPNSAGCTYCSYGLDGKVVTKNFNNITDALAAAKAAGYTREEHWKIGEGDAANAAAAARAFDGTPYNLTAHNCWSMVFSALSAAGTSAEDWGSIPNVDFVQNEQLADGWSNL